MQNTYLEYLIYKSIIFKIESLNFKTLSKLKNNNMYLVKIVFGLTFLLIHKTCLFSNKYSSIFEFSILVTSPKSLFVI